MTILNHRWERFAQHVASGESATAAYRAAYGAKGASAETAASRLFRRDEVSLRVEELRKQAAGASAVEEAKTAARVAGKIVLALAKKRELLAGFATARKLDVKDRMRAIELDARLAGELKGDAATFNVGVRVNTMTEDERAELMAMKRRAIEQQRASMAMEQPRTAALTNGA